jgi:hypothetical protein
MAQIIGLHRFLHDYEQIVVYQDSDGNVKSNTHSDFTLASPTTPASGNIIGLYNYQHGVDEVVVYQDGAGNVKSNTGIS